ncbi:helix-turn-helix transcriptional regulator [Rubritalea spongiae]|uniref:Helix-turn-helix transcriptional regulator n=1 Tax=Rubritalea spongiae TaxID=430797 RepID=A0ABW5E070_9BACT
MKAKETLASQTRSWLTNPFTTMIQDIQIGSSTQVINRGSSREPKATHGFKTRTLKSITQNKKSQDGSIAKITNADQLSLLKLFGGIASSQETLSEKKQSALNQVAELIGSDAWFWCRVSEEFIVAGSEQTNYVGGGELGQYIQEMLKSHIFQVYRAQEVGSQRTMVINDGGPFSCIYSLRKMEDGNTSLFVSFRTEHNTSFTESETHFLDLSLGYLPFIHDYVHDAKKMALTPKMKLVLKFLKEGHSRKMIAAQLGISVNTVSAYVRDIYREYDVHSHAELIKYFHDAD